MKKTAPLLILIFVLLIGGSQAFFTVYQTQKAIILQLGKPVGEPRGPGLHFKIPFVQNVIYFDSRLLEYDAEPAEVLTSDKKNLVVDNYSKWRIVNPLRFYRTVQTIPRAQARLDDIIYSQLRVALGRYTLTEIVSTKRAEIMSKVTKKSSELIQEFGIQVVDVRIKRTDLPPENEKAIFNRMRAERERQAMKYRSEGQERASVIKSGADKERAVILAEAKKQASEVRGEGDAQATKIYAEAVSQSPDFYAFKRSLDAYEAGFQDNTRIILTPENRFLRYIK